MNTWDLSAFPATERYAYWREVLCQAYVALDPVVEERSGFAGKVRAAPLSAVNVTTISSVRQKIHRGRAEISQMPVDVYFLNLQVRGQCRMIQHGREALLQPGQFAIVDSTDPYTVDYCSDDWEQHSFRFPKRLLEPLLLRSDRVTATLIDGSLGIGAVARTCLESIAQNVSAITTQAAPLCRSMVDIVASALTGTTASRDEQMASVRRGLICAITEHLQLHLADPELCPANVATHFRISTRYLHKILEEGGVSFGRMLLDARLDRCAEHLGSNPDLPIGQVAMAWGFNDLSHFSRTFKKRFGLSPREYRAQLPQTMAGLLLPPCSRGQFAPPQLPRSTPRPGGVDESCGLT